MSQEIEIEFKQLIDEDTFNKMLQFYPVNASFKQINHYFETEQMLLKKNGAALRVREKEEELVLTLKQPHETGLLETHQAIGVNSFHALKEKGLLPQGETTEQLISLCGQMPHLRYLGSLETVRSEADLPEGTLVLDRSDYAGVTDFELEFECTDAEEGKKFFFELLQSWSLTWNEPDNKIARFYRAAYES
ncbi:CYTH domain-containing protein [Alkalicoccus daliensis]|uniref:Uncharacterized protein YjbK n=1 Tax=Alkalicoccus daliensis TaxID=745820 RepID=A0A1G9ZFT0_9BACI|nr:CYTH domain-containing protein [Alkalicoccus daliensis]SDN20280.1 Uncharacterized protein YjbK [Alkalicoccus daliensis]